MKLFNQTITVEVSVDSIAQQLLGAMSPEFKHSEMVAEAIVGTLLDRQAISNLYNALNGFKADINFEVGDEIVLNTTSIPARVYGYWTPESIERKSSVNGNITQARVLEVNEYAVEKIRIAYDVPQLDGSYKVSERWDNHTKWDRIPVVAKEILS
jgi:hypothetical protein